MHFRMLSFFVSMWLGITGIYFTMLLKLVLKFVSCLESEKGEK